MPPAYGDRGAGGSIEPPGDGAEAGGGGRALSETGASGLKILSSPVISTTLCCAMWPPESARRKSGLKADGVPFPDFGVGASPELVRWAGMVTVSFEPAGSKVGSSTKGSVSGGAAAAAAAAAALGADDAGASSNAEAAGMATSTARAASASAATAGEARPAPASAAALALAAAAAFFLLSEPGGLPRGRLGLGAASSTGAPPPSPPIADVACCEAESGPALWPASWPPPSSGSASSAATCARTRLTSTTTDWVTSSATRAPLPSEANPM